MIKRRKIRENKTEPRACELMDGRVLIVDDQGPHTSLGDFFSPAI
jgi:hypothetical protein